MTKRRKFIKVLGGTVGILAANNVVGRSSIFPANSYRNIIGSNERVNMAIIGLNGRGHSMSGSFAQNKDVLIKTICDVDSRTFSKVLQKLKGYNKPNTEKDCRRVLEDKDIDAIYVATPDHWHVPLTVMGCKAGKHVYVEKPLGHDPNEGELVISAVRKYDRIVQMGAQRRSSKILKETIDKLHDGIIGRVYFAKAWYTNERKATYLKAGNVPSELDYDLWQGPAPRVKYKDGLIHYNWHWFWNWGTGEALNNGTHEVDLARWGLGVDFPIRVSSVGGRYQFKDDWETPDTQIITVDYPGRKSLMWENRSCNGRKIEGADRGVIFYGDNGSLDTDGFDYKIYDLSGTLIDKFTASSSKNSDIQGRNLASPSLDLDSSHIDNFIESIKNNHQPNCDVETGNKSCLPMQLGNISWRLNRDLKTDPGTGHILDDDEAQKLWRREYEKGWEPVV